MSKRLCGWLITAIFLLPAPLSAHGFSRSVSNWHISDAGEVELIFLAPLIAAERIPYGDPEATAEARFADHLARTIKLTQGADQCARLSITPQIIAANQLRMVLRFRCAEKAPSAATPSAATPSAATPPAAAPRVASPLLIEVASFFDSDPSHIHFARFFFGGRKIERLFSDQARRYQIDLTEPPQAESGAAVFVDYVPLGWRHILAGLDHLAFLAALLLVCGFSRAIIWTVTGFTLGHSLTLGLAASALITAKPDMIEALIGFTILMMAVERAGLALGYFRAICFSLASGLLICLLFSFWFVSTLSPLAWLGLALFAVCWGFYVRDIDHAKRVVPLISVLFGLIHGFGFAAILREGLPAGHFLAALAGFNIGVELGQLFFVALILAAVMLLRPLAERYRIWREAPYLTAAILTGLGTYWLLARAFF